MPPFVSSAWYGVAGLPPLPALARRLQRQRLLVLCYHGVVDDDAPVRHWLLARRSEFAAQVAHLAAHYECVPVDEGLERLWSGRLRRPTACVTFDDGYRSNLTLALPILERHGVPATVYLATDFIGTDRRLWTTTIEFAIRDATVPHADLSPIGLGTVPLGDAAQRRALGWQVAQRLKALAAAERRARVPEVLAALAAGPVQDGGAFAMLDWAEVDRLAASGLVTLGAHTAGHEILARLSDDEVEHEVGVSVAAVAARVPERARTRSFAYPNGQPGDFDGRAERALARAGVTAAFTTVEGWTRRATRPLALERVSIGSGTPARRFAVEAAGLSPRAVSALMRPG